MINVLDIHSLSSFQRKTRDHIRRLKRTGRPAVLTVNGEAAVIVQDANAYQELVSRLEIDTGKAVRGARPEFQSRRDPVIEAYKADIDRSLLRENLRRSVDERLANLVALQRLAGEARGAGRREGSST